MQSLYYDKLLVSRQMPNGKGSPEWGWFPSGEEIIVALVIFIFTLIISKNVIASIGFGIIGGFLMLWANNGWPEIRR